MRDRSREFAEVWIAAWNARDLDRVLDHYAPDIVFLSPVAERVTGSGRVSGIAALRSYWEQALAQNTDLRFQLVDVLEGAEAVTILYRNQRGLLVAETFEHGSGGKVVRACACYSAGSAP